MAEISGGRVLVRQRLCWMDSVRKGGLGQQTNDDRRLRESALKIGQSGEPWCI